MPVMKVGLVLPLADEGQGHPSWPAIGALARRAEAGGIDSLWVYDHLLWRTDEEPESGPYEGWTILAAVAAVTERVELGSLVFAAPFRNPGLFAKMAATADVVAPGRIVLGLGAGWHRPEFDAFGLPFDHRVGRFEDALAIVAPLLRGERVTLDGRWEHASDAVLLPPPGGRVHLLVAAKGERMLRLTARHADAWNTAWFGRPDERFRTRLADLRAACDAEGRDPATLEVTVGLEVARAGKEPGPNEIAADVEAVADAFRAWAAEGVAHVQVVAPPMDEAAYDLVCDAAGRFRV